MLHQRKRCQRVRRALQIVLGSVCQDGCVCSLQTPDCSPFPSEGQAQPKSFIKPLEWVNENHIFQGDKALIEQVWGTLRNPPIHPKILPLKILPLLMKQKPSLK